MSRTFFRFQAVFVLALCALVSWPHFRPARAAPTVWRTGGPLEPQRDLSADRRVTGGESTQRVRKIGYGSAGASDAAGPGRGSAAHALDETGLDDRRMLPDTPADVAAAGGLINAIVGRARTALNTPVPYARMALRNLVTGKIEAHATADHEGHFTFLDVVPSGYVVELVGADGSVIAASDVMTVGKGDMKQATVRVASASTVAAVFGNTLGPTVAEPVKAAADSHVSKVNQQDATLSPRR